MLVPKNVVQQIIVEGIHFGMLSHGTCGANMEDIFLNSEWLWWSVNIPCQSVSHQDNKAIAGD